MNRYCWYSCQLRQGIEECIGLHTLKFFGGDSNILKFSYDDGCGYLFAI